jgi:RecA/RadA recombinase
MAVRDRRTATLAARRPTAKTRHLGGEAAFIDEEQTLRVEIGLAVEPRLAFGFYVRALLL